MDSNWRPWRQWSLRGFILLVLVLILVGLSFPWNPILRWALFLIFLALLLLPLRGLVGPLFLYDLVRTSRRNPHIPLRCLYGGLLLGMLFLFYSSWFPSVLDRWENWFRGGTVPLGELHLFARSFFTTFLSVQLAAVVLVTPAVTAGTIIEEKERRTLDYLLATPLTDWEIVVGLLASRVSGLGLLLLTGLPLLELLQMFGGVELELVLAAFAGTFMTLVSLGSLCLLISIHAKKSLNAFCVAYAGRQLTVLVDCLGNPWNRSVVPVQDGGEDGHGAEGIAKEVPKNIPLCGILFSPARILPDGEGRKKFLIFSQGPIHRLGWAYLIGRPFKRFDHPLALFIGQPIPNTAATGSAEQAHFSAAHIPAQEEFEHFFRIPTFQPFLLGHCHLSSHSTRPCKFRVIQLRRTGPSPVCL